jgi:nucleotide-binding universal stress UspA family protein
MKQRILVADERIRSMIEHDSDEGFLRKSAQFTYRYAIALTLLLVLVWPLPLYVSGYVFTPVVYHLWVGIAVAWTVCAAVIVIFLPLIEGRRAIAEVIRRIATLHLDNAEHGSREGTSQRSSEEYDSRKILVAVDGSKESLRALSYASYLFEETSPARIFLLNVIEWSDENEDGSTDSGLAEEMEEQGRRMLRSVVIPKKAKRYERIVKLGDPGAKIAETADKLNVDMIVMGRKGLGGSQSDMGHVSAKVLRLSSKPLVLL